MEDEELENDTGVQPLSRHDILEKEKEKNKADHLQPWQYKKGQSGNPAGRAKGISLKEYVKKNFIHMTDDERETFLNGIGKTDVWKMGEGSPDTKTDITSKGEQIGLATEDLEEFASYTQWKKKQISKPKK